MSARTIAVACGTAMTAFTTAYFVWPAWSPALWAGMGLTAIAAMLTGIRRNRPRRRSAWWVLAAGLTLQLAGDAAYDVQTVVLGLDNPYPSIADVFYLSSMLTLASGLVLLARAGVAGRNRASALDALTVTLGLGLLSWILLIQPYVVTPGLTAAQRLVSVAYPLGDVLMLLTVARVLAVARRGTSVTLLATAVVTLLASDFWFGLSQLEGGWEGGGLVDLGWVVCYAALGAAALHPSMTRLTEPRVVRQGELSAWRLVLLAVASLIAPAVLLVEAVAGTVTDGAVIAVLSAAMFGLVLIRLAGVMGNYRHSLARAEALREYGAALVAAADADQVHAAVRAALPALVRANGLEPVALFVPTADLTPCPGGRPCLARRDELPPEVAERLDSAVVLRSPLARADRPDGRPTVELLVAADERTLVELLPSVDLLAAQAALALDRIALNDEVNRRIGEAYFRTLVHNSTDVILILGEDDKIRYASPSAAQLLDRPSLLGVRLLNLVSDADRPRARELLGGVRAGELGSECADWTVVRADGGAAEVEVSCRDLRGDPTVGGLVVTLRDVTERRRLEAELSHQALHDSLTGLANRVLFHDRVGRAMQRASRNGTLAGALFVDLDDFKVVNETLGHDRGDEVLVAVGERLVEVLREHDTAARLGGDEFAILVEDATHPADVEQVAERVLAVLAVPVDVGGDVLSCNASVGVAMTTDARTAPDLLRQADLALFLAKSEGKHRWRRYDTTLHTALLQRLEVRAALEQAVADDAFVLHYQPIVGLADGVAVGYEALVRWQHPERGLVPPVEFIEVAEESGLIVPLGSWVLRTALAAAAGWWRDHPGAAPYVSVNVSARQFRASGFVDEVRAALTGAGLPGRALLLELTESLLLREDEQVWADLATLQTLGVRTAIDDFGTGYSSLSYLRQMPIDIVKIDRSFVRSMATSPQQGALVDGIIRLAHTLGLAVVAEGVEERSQCRQLAEMGCRHGQGFLFARPMPAGELGPWLAPARVHA
jgi:diguanylate cyclase (GGDEF)-like protein/PAS domain S-box-containing protein